MLHLLSFSHKNKEGEFFFSPIKQKLLEEIEDYKDKVDDCQKYAKAYIDTIKVSVISNVLLGWNHYK